MNRFLSQRAGLVLAFSLLIVEPVALVLVHGALQAQTTISGDIAGTVTDPSGSAVPGATVTATDTATGAVKVVKTGDAGGYRVPLPQPGAYTLSVADAGFKTAQLNVTVQVGQITNGNVTLSMAQASESVEVESSTVPLLQTDNSDLSTTISMEQVQDLPNSGGDITYPVQTSQGVVMNTHGGSGSSSAFGLPATSNNFTLNGAEQNDPFLNLNNSGPSNLLLGLNDVDEVSVVANAYGAQYGSLGGIQENIISRSGGNRFHGNATYYWTNSDMTANDWFNDHSAARQPFSNANQWGSSIGGPLVKDKTFFFVNDEGLRFVTAPADFVLIPSTSYESAVFANLATTNPAEIPFYQKMFSLYNSAPGALRATPYAGTTYANSFEANPKNFLPENLVTARLDHKLGANDNMFVHFKRDHGVQPTYVDPINSAFNAESDQPDYEGQLEETHTFSPNVVNVVDSNVTDALEPNYGNLATTWMLADVVNPAIAHHCGKAATATPCFGGSSTTDFANPTSFGGQRRNQFTGPGYFNTDLSVLKGFKVPGLESGKFRIGAQAYNVLNHPNFQNPDFDVSSPTFGSIVSTASTPTSVFGSFLGGDASPRIVQLKAVFQF